MPCCPGVGVRVDEDMSVIERSDQLELVAHQHAVAEHVSRHVADAHDRDRSRIGVDAQLVEVPLHRLPGTAGRDPQLLVVVAGGPPGRESRRRARIRTRQRGRWPRRRTSPCPLSAATTRYGSSSSSTTTPSGWNHTAVDKVVGDVEQAADELFVGRLHCSAQLRPPPQAGCAARSPPSTLSVRSRRSWSSVPSSSRGPRCGSPPSSSTTGCRPG